MKSIIKEVSRYLERVLLKFKVKNHIELMLTIFGYKFTHPKGTMQICIHLYSLIFIAQI